MFRGPRPLRQSLQYKPSEAEEAHCLRHATAASFQTSTILASLKSDSLPARACSSPCKLKTGLPAAVSTKKCLLRRCQAAHPSSPWGLEGLLLQDTSTQKQHIK
eukprot:GHUV01039530.1.p2 GENE.GHUV01039530.1~~GHUV01039530.1.p2  ORF type:complete len:104 (+),score=15.00 GHUV01039530.1:574-885(+)